MPSDHSDYSVVYYKGADGMCIKKGPLALSSVASGLPLFQCVVLEYSYDFSPFYLSGVHGQQRAVYRNESRVMCR